MTAIPLHKIEAAPTPTRYARGWHCLGLADAYKTGKPHGLNIFGTRLVAFTGESGKIYVMDAWCPHMGADLAIGCIKGESVVCKFHDWAWDGRDGICNHIPYANRIPPKARIKSWPSCEQNKMLFVWNDPEGSLPPPELDIPRIDAVFSSEWSDWTLIQWTINNNCRELIDNIADSAHFLPVHGGTGIAYFANLFEGHKATQMMVGTFPELGGAEDYLTTVATYYGPAYQITHMFGNMNGVPIESILLNSHTPIDGNNFDLRFGVMVKKIPGMDAAMCDAMVKGYVEKTQKAFSEDVQIWHNKIRIDNPLLCEGDGPVYQNRQWYEQFYTNLSDVPSDMKNQKIVEQDKGVPTKPKIHHAFEG